MANKYRKKPVEIEALQYKKGNIHRVMSWIEKFVKHNSEVIAYNNKSNNYEIKTLEGNHTVSEGDYIIKGVKGEFYPCKPDIFEQTYEKVVE